MIEKQGKEKKRNRQSMGEKKLFSEREREREGFKERIKLEIKRTIVSEVLLSCSDKQKRFV